jgi:hypothetical protein
LVGFNPGVEIDRLANVAAVLPFIVAPSRFLFYSPVVMKFGSVGIAPLALHCSGWPRRGAGFSYSHSSTAEWV